MARQPALVYGGMPRVNLMPQSELDRRSRDALSRRWGWVVLGAALVTAVIVAGAYSLTWIANQSLATEQAKTTTLVAELGELSDVSTALSVEQELKSFTAQAMGSDFEWRKVVNIVESALPGAVTLVGFDVTSGGVPASGSDPTTAVGLLGTFTFTSPTPIDMAAAIRSVRAADSVLSADGQSLTSSNVDAASFEYLLTVSFDQSIYSGKFDETAAN